MPDEPDAPKLEDWAVIQTIPERIVDAISRAAVEAYLPLVRALEAEVHDLRASLDERDDLIAAVREQLSERPAQKHE